MSKETKDPKSAKAAELEVSVASLEPVDFTCWATKQGGKIKTWKKRWFVLKGERLWYFQGQKDERAKGYIEIHKGVTVSESDKKKNGLIISSKGIKGERSFMIVAENPDKLREFVAQLKKKIEGTEASQPGSPPVTTPQQQPQTPTQTPETTSQPAVQTTPTQAQPPAAPSLNQTQVESLDNSARTVEKQPSGGDIHPKIKKVKDIVGFISAEKDGKTQDFYNLWIDSVPFDQEQNLDFFFSIPTDFNKITFSVLGPQDLMIQKLVDFFWTVGASDSEISLLNDVGSALNPTKIGSWVDMCAKEGMDGGWLFPIPVNLQDAFFPSETGKAYSTLKSWLGENGINQVVSIGRDMSDVTPKQMEYRFEIKDGDFNAKVEKVNLAFETFNFPVIPSEFFQLLTEICSSNPIDIFNVYVTVAVDEFAKICVSFPLKNSTPSDMRKLFTFRNPQAEENFDKIEQINTILSTTGTPSFIDISYLKPPFGYNCYKEGFDVIFKYSFGCEKKL